MPHPAMRVLPCAGRANCATPTSDLPTSDLPCAMSVLTVTRAPHLIARILRRTALHYRAGADSVLDRPAYLRAASALAWIGDRLVIVQDDASFLALADPLDSRADSVTLPAGPAGRRQFDDARGNKAHKLDLESCVTLDDDGGTTLVAFGSGSSPARERIVIAAGLNAETPIVRVVAAPTLYAVLRAAADFAGSELNIEGAVLVDQRELRLFGRGNGAPRDGRTPVNATCALDWRQLWRHLHDPTVAPPQPHSITRYDLRAIEGIPLGFTDAVAVEGGMIFSAAAEASPDAVSDGHVSGSVLGLIPDHGAPTWMPIVDEHGAPFTGKFEGLASSPDAATIYAVADADDPAKASELCVIRIEAP